MKSKSLLAVGALLTMLATTSTVFAGTMPNTVSENGRTLMKSSIVVNGKTEYSAYVFAAKDPNDGVETTFIPIWYIMQVLNQNGSNATWNGNFKTPGKGILSVQSTTYKGGLNIQDSKGHASIVINGSASNGENGVPNFPEIDPSSGKATSFFGLYYAQQLLNTLGFQNTWNGVTHTWTITAPSSATTSTVSPTPANIQKAVTEAESNQKAGKTGVYGMLSTSTQWYNDPGVKFYDKKFPVSDLKDGYVIQEKPYTKVFTKLSGASTVVAKYVGKGSNSIQGSVTFWEVENVNPKTGDVTTVIPYMALAAVGLDKNYTAPNNVQGINFGSNAGPVMKNYNEYWGTGQGLDVVPKQNWNPLSK